MKKLLLNINYLIFSWYYKIVPDHFKHWTFIKSVKILIQNYEHRNLLFKNEQDHNKALIIDNDKLRIELSQFRISQLASSKQIKDLNKMFGTNHNTPEDN